MCFEKDCTDEIDLDALFNWINANITIEVQLMLIVSILLIVVFGLWDDYRREHLSNEEITKQKNEWLQEEKPKNDFILTEDGEFTEDLPL